MFTVALAVSIVGWTVVAWFVALLAFVGPETSCTAHRGQAYRDCVRGGDLTALRVQGFVVGLAVLAVVLVVVASARGRRSAAPERRRQAALIATGSLVAVSVLGWILGPITLWAPDRPLRYDPVAVSYAHTVLALGGVIGLLVGGLVVLGMIRAGRKGPIT